MARSFEFKEARRLIQNHREVMSYLEQLWNLASQYRNDISAAVQYTIDTEVMQLLKAVPIEEINRDKLGIKIKTLREHGYQTVADIAKVPVQQIDAIYGISEDSAYTILHIVQAIVGETAKTVKLKLSYDDQNAASNHLVLALSKYRQGKPHAEDCYKLLLEHRRDIARAIEDLTPGTGMMNWLFASKAQKQNAEKAYAFLDAMMRSGYFTKAKAGYDALHAVDKMSVQEAWEDFRLNSVRFYNILEEVTPGVLGTDDTVYGLPEALANDIKEEIFHPEGLKCELRRYQEWGVKYILRQKRVLLGDEMGLGKTVQAIAAMVSLRNTGGTHFVVVCPASVLSNWCRELVKHSDLSVVKIYGDDREEALKRWVEQGGVAVTTYETTAHIKPEAAFRYCMLVVDEAHYIKNPAAKRTGYVKRLGTHAERMLFMTGTALENNVDEMIRLIEILQPQVAAAVQDKTFLAAAPQFRELVASVYYRRKREDVLTELPDLIDSKEWCILQPEEEAIYEEAVLNNRYADARRVSFNVPDLRYSSKARRLVELVEEAKEDGRKVIVFSFFLDTIQKVCRLMGGQAMEPITGAVSPERRQEIIDGFDRAAAGTVLVAQIQSGGTGLNIQSASVVILCEPQFKPSTENQAISRAYRMGQTRNVLVYRLLCDETVDERILDLLEEKQRIFDAFADESVAGEESLELDEKAFGNIMAAEAERIQGKQQAGTNNLSGEA